LQDPISKKPTQKRAGGVAQGVSPEVQTPVPQKKKKKVCRAPTFNSSGELPRIEVTIW
jgi:hypothetical protein